MKKRKPTAYQAQYCLSRIHDLLAVQKWDRDLLELIEVWIAKADTMPRAPISKAQRKRNLDALHYGKPLS